MRQEIREISAVANNMETENMEDYRALTAHAVGLFKAFCYLAVITILAAAGFQGIRAQDTHSNPARGAKLGNAYSVGDFDTINTTNGNLSLNFPLGSLPAGRGSASAGVYLTYNSKLYNMRTEKRSDYRRTADTYYDRTVIEADFNKGGWRIGAGYSLEVQTRFGITEPPCTSEASETNLQVAYSKKLLVVFPDGSTHEMIPYGYKDVLGDRYFNIDMSGLVRTCNSLTYASRPVYYSRDGSFLRLETTSASSWTLYFPDGSRVENGGRVFDRNGNYVDVGNGATDQLGRSVTISSDNNGDELVTSKGVGGEDVVWRIRWKTIAVRKTFKACPNDNSCPADDFPLPYYRDVLLTTFTVVDKIFQPAQLGGGVYTFSYNGGGSNPLPTTNTQGWGELSGVELPTGAKISYDYLMDGQDGPDDHSSTKDILKNYPIRKTLKYDLEYDGQTIDDGAVETWLYQVSPYGGGVTAPDGGVTTTIFGATDQSGNNPLPWNSGLALATISPDGTKVENLWDRNIPTACTSTSTCSSGSAGEHADNPYIKTEFTSIKSADGNYVKTAIKDYTYDKNGNVIEVREYDWIPYGDVPRVNGSPTGVPSGASAYLKRVSRTVYYNDTPEASSTIYGDPDSYFLTGNKRLLRLTRSAEILDASLTPKSRSEIEYDFTNYDSGNSKAGNPSTTKVFDSTKGGYSNPLTSSNWITTTAAYNEYGMPVTMTDAKGTVTQITYGNILGPNGNITNLYPTQTVAAYGTALARTSTAVYDFYSGVVKSTTDVDTGLTNATEYDALGRPTKAIVASGNENYESWTVTAYDDLNRRIIVRSDLETKGDGKKVAAQFFDQIGRVRLVKTLEDATTQSATNETDGIKVQTRYKTANGFTYRLSSNPYRAATTLAASLSVEPEMGWTVSTATSTGRHSEVETFAGNQLPAPWGDNVATSGKVQSDIDANRTLVTDQAGKQRISKSNGLGQLTELWEIRPTADDWTEAVTFPSTPIALGYKTTYAYDTLANLTTVLQGAQTRSFSYSSLSRLLTATNPESGTINYVYDNVGNLTQKTDARNVSTNYIYDNLNRVTSRTYSAPSGLPNYSPTLPVYYTYDDPSVPSSKGRLTKVTTGPPTDPFSETKYLAYDLLGRVTVSQQHTDGTTFNPQSYVYNLSGALIEETYPSGRVVKNVLDVSGDLVRVRSNKSTNAAYSNYAQNFKYSAAGALSSVQLGNLNWESTVFNSRLQPIQIALGRNINTTDLLQLDYSYGGANNNGNVSSQTIKVPNSAAAGDPSNAFMAVQTYNYDSLNRITHATETIGGVEQWQQTFVFDRYGNRNFNEAQTTTLPKSCGTPPTVTVCQDVRNKMNPVVSTADNRLSTAAGYLYDSAGNTTRDAENRVFVYDAENKQTEVRTAADVVIGRYLYDGDGKRVKKISYPGTTQQEVMVFVYDAGGRSIAEYASNPVALSQAKVNFVTNDHLGSPRINTDVGGRTIARHDFLPFGEEIQRPNYGVDDVRQRFTAFERESETSLDFAHARYYHTDHGRFNSVDPVLITKSRLIDPQALGLYVYARNSPLVYIDPDGRYFIGANNKRVTLRLVGGSIRYSKNASADLKRIIDSTNRTQSNKAISQIMKANESITGFRVRIDSSEKAAEESAVNGRMTPHDDNGRELKVGKDGKPFDGMPSYICCDNDGNLVYKEVTITLFEKNFSDNGVFDNLTMVRDTNDDPDITEEENMVAVFGHEIEHGLNQIDIRVLRSKQLGWTTNIESHAWIWEINRDILREIRERRSQGSPTPED